MGKLLLLLRDFCPINTIYEQYLVLYIRIFYTNYITKKEIKYKIIINTFIFLLTQKIATFLKDLQIGHWFLVNI